MQTQEAQNDAITLDDLFTVSELAATSRHLKEATLRWQLRNRDINGLAAACVQIGKKLLISKSRYERWLATQIGGRAAA
jgi:hypothetical protein